MGPEPDPDDLTPGMSIWGWMLPTELRWLMERASTMSSVVEVGSLHGRSAFALLTACPGKVYCVDSWSDEFDASYGSFMGHCGHFPNLVPVRAFSPEAVVEVPGKVDMTFIDGSHVYPAVLADIAAWLPKTTKLICGHDYAEVDGGFPGVAEAVHEVFGEARVHRDDGTSIWWVDLTIDRSTSPALEDREFVFVDEYDRDRRVEVNW